MIVSAHQPAYLPWLGYFDKIAQSDVFVLFDDVQFEKNSFTNRNLIKTATGPSWLTVPVKAGRHIDRTMIGLEIANEHQWKDKHLKAIIQNYRKAPHFSFCYPHLLALFESDDATLLELCDRHLAFWLKQLEITTSVRPLSTLGLQSRKSTLVLDACLALKADRYISGALGRDYLDLAAFSAAGISVEFQRFVHPRYSQLYGDFVPNLSIIDFWMNTGPGAAAAFRQQRLARSDPRRRE